jgi:hypothetical protein
MQKPGDIVRASRLTAGGQMKAALTVVLLCHEARVFSEMESRHAEPTIYGITDGKAIGTYFEHKFRDYLSRRYVFGAGSSAAGIDFPELQVDMKVTSINQPQSSCPYKSARQKIFGLGYSLLIFVYAKQDDQATRTGTLNMLHVILVDSARTADFQTTTGIRRILENNGNVDDLVAFMYDRNLPIDDIEAHKIAEELLYNAPGVGYLTISNALQWRLQYRRAIEQAGLVDGVVRVL